MNIPEHRPVLSQFKAADARSLRRYVNRHMRDSKRDPLELGVLLLMGMLADAIDEAFRPAKPQVKAGNVVPIRPDDGPRAA